MYLKDYLVVILTDVTPHPETVVAVPVEGSFVAREMEATPGVPRAKIPLIWEKKCFISRRVSDSKEKLLHISDKNWRP